MRLSELLDSWCSPRLAQLAKYAPSLQISGSPSDDQAERTEVIRVEFCPSDVIVISRSPGDGYSPGSQSQNRSLGFGVMQDLRRALHQGARIGPTETRHRFQPPGC